MWDHCKYTNYASESKQNRKIRVIFKKEYSIQCENMPKNPTMNLYIITKQKRIYSDNEQKKQTGEIETSLKKLSYR